MKVKEVHENFKEELMENKVMDEDSDSDVVLLSDDETELCSTNSTLHSKHVSPSMFYWQEEILSETWTEWPVLEQDILLHLCQDTGLGQDIIKDWFENRTDEELAKVWG